MIDMYPLLQQQFTSASLPVYLSVEKLDSLGDLSTLSTQVS